MAVFNNIVIRCELFPDEVDPNTKFTNIRTARTPAMYAGAQVEFQFALFKKKASTSSDAELYDISQFTGLPKMRIRQANAAGTVLLDETVASQVEKDPALTLASWQDGSSQHFRFAFPETATGIAVGTQFIVIYGPDGDVFGVSDILVSDPGTGAAASPTPSAAGYYTKPEVDGKLQDKLNAQLADNQPISFYATNAAGARCRITLQPVWDESGIRLVHIPEAL